MNYIAVLLSSIMAANDRALSFVLVAENLSPPIDVVTSKSQQSLTERILNPSYIQS